MALKLVVECKFVCSCMELLNGGVEEGKPMAESHVRASSVGKR